MGVQAVVKNAFFTYIKSDTGLKAHRQAVQVWNSSSSGWTFEIYLGGSYNFNGKSETNTFHKKHLVTLGVGRAIADKAKSIFEKRTINISTVNSKRNTTAGEFVSGYKSELPDNMSGKEKTNAARLLQQEAYYQKGYGNKMTGDTLSVIDCSAFAGVDDIAVKFADALARGATGVAPNAHEFVTGGVWHPTVDFGTPCVHVCTGGVISGVKNKALVQVHLLEVDGANHHVKCHVHHLSQAVD